MCDVSAVMLRWVVLVKVDVQAAARARRRNRMITVIILSLVANGDCACSELLAANVSSHPQTSVGGVKWNI